MASAWPCIVAYRNVVVYPTVSSSLAMLYSYRTSLDSYRTAAAAGALLPRLDAATLSAQSSLLKKYSDDVKALAGTKVQSGVCVEGTEQWAIR